MLKLLNASMDETIVYYAMLIYNTGKSVCCYILFKHSVMLNGDTDVKQSISA